MPNDLKDTDCKKGQISQRRPVAYTKFKYKHKTAESNKIKLRLPSGDQITCALVKDMLDTKNYVKHLMLFDRIMEEKKLDAKPQATSKDLWQCG